MHQLYLLLKSTSLPQWNWNQGGWPEQHGLYRKYLKLHPTGLGVPLPWHRESWGVRAGKRDLASVGEDVGCSWSSAGVQLSPLPCAPHHPPQLWLWELLPSPISWLCVSKERRFAVYFGRHLHPLLLWQIAHKVQSLSTFSLIPTQVFFQGWYQSWWLLSCWLQTQVPFPFLLCSLLSHCYQSKINYLQVALPLWHCLIL